jgi:hypothetical protein
MLASSHGLASTNMRQKSTGIIAHYLERIASALEGRPVPVDQAVSTAQPCASDASNAASFKKLDAELGEIRSQLAEIKELLTAERGDVVKEAYTVEEVAKKTNYAPFTIRQACNKGRISGVRKGKEGAWRIPHASLLDIINNGLPSE